METGFFLIIIFFNLFSFCGQILACNQTQLAVLAVVVPALRSRSDSGAWIPIENLGAQTIHVAEVRITFLLSCFWSRSMQLPSRIIFYFYYFFFFWREGYSLLSRTSFVNTDLCQNEAKEGALARPDTLCCHGLVHRWCLMPLSHLTL